MKKTFAVILAFLLIFIYTVPTHAAEYNDGYDSEIYDVTEAETTEYLQTTEYPKKSGKAPDLVSKSAIVMDVKTGQILYEKNAQKKKYPASITKIMTTVVALDQEVNFDDTITMSENAIWDIERDSTHIGLDVGEKISVEECIYATMVQSANECAYALAEHVAGDLTAFADLMNAKAEELGCVNTHFVNPHGLHNKKHYTCAYDMALITRYALQNDTFREIAGTLSYTVSKTNLVKQKRELWNGNRMIYPDSDYYYKYCEGGKTGFTNQAKNTLVTFAKKGDLELICVVLDANGYNYTYSDTKALFNYCFNKYKYYSPLTDFSFSSATERTSHTDIILDNYYNTLNHDMVNLSVDKNFTLLIDKSIKINDIEQKFSFYQNPEGTKLGEIEFIYDDKRLGSTPINSTSSLLPSKLIEETEETHFSTLDLLKRIGAVILILFGIIIAILLIYLFLMNFVGNAKRRKHNRRYRKNRNYRRKKDNDYHI